MPNSEFRRIKADLSDWIHIGRWSYPLAFTLTCQKAFNDGDGYIRPVTEHDCHKNLRHVMKVLNHNILGSARSRKQRIPLFPVLERNADGRFHFHGIIDIPKEADERFVQTLQHVWRWSRVGYREMDFQIADQGWVQYILKARSKAHYLDAIDVGNIVLPTDPPLVAKAGGNKQYPTWYKRDPIREWIRLLQALKAVQLDLKDRRPF